MKKIITLLLIFVFTGMPAANAAKQPVLSQLELREIQTRTFETGDTDLVYKAVINTLQDNGFIIQNIENEVGYIKAQKDFKGKYRDKKRLTGYSALLAYYVTLSVFSFGATLPYIYDPVMRIKNEMALKTAIVNANVNIEPYGKNSTKVRLIMVQKILENADGYSFIKSSPRQVIRIREPILYTEFFNQLDKNIFYEKI